MNIDPTCDTWLILKCRCCSNLDYYFVPEADARAVEAAFLDEMPVLTFQAADSAGVLRTMNVTRADFRAVQVAPLTEDEMRETRRKAKGAVGNPSTSIKLSAMLHGSGKVNIAKIGGAK